MPQHEHAPSTPERQLSPEEQEKLTRESQERLQEHHESNVERAPERNAHEARHEVEQALSDKEREQIQHERTAPIQKGERQRPITRASRDANFKHVMGEVQQQLKPTSRVFSKIIHVRPIEKTSEVIGTTLARPNAILSGAVFAFILTLAVYLIGHHFGYPLSGFESIGAFILGWVIGILYDFLRVMITGKHA